VPVVANVSARPLADIDDIRNELVAQLTWPVRWSSSVQWMVQGGASRFVEVGPKDVLAKLVRRSDPRVETTNVSDASAVASLTRNQ
jgi:[acyl-carrier-protein] S-malonyltransferase